MSEHDMLITLLQLMVIVAAARAGGWAFQRLGQPVVVGEIMAGLLLGPSALGRFDLGPAAQLLPRTMSAPLQMLSELGLIFLMFLVGMEFEFGHLRRFGRTALGISLAGMVLPLVLGAGLGLLMHQRIAAQIDFTSFVLFMAVSMSITAIPILGRIMIDFGLTRTRLGALTITAAAVDDAMGWILLATIHAFVRGHVGGGGGGQFDYWITLRMLTLTVGLALFMIFAARPLLIRWITRSLAANRGELSLGALSLLLLIILATAVTTHWIGIFAVFGPFILGSVLWDQHAFREAVNRRLRDFVYSFFLPIFFTYTGLRTDIGNLDTPEMWFYCGLVLVAATFGKMFGCGLAARAGGMTGRESWCVATMMNTRALMELIVVNLGMQLGVIPESVYCMLVIMAVVTTLMTAPMLRRLLPGIDLHGTGQHREKRMPEPAGV